MIQLRPAAERGTTRLAWLDSRHTFSFADYQDPRHMGFRALRVINEDRVAPAGGFAPHTRRTRRSTSSRSGSCPSAAGSRRATSSGPFRWPSARASSCWSGRATDARAR
jgi:hypothetical protein